MSTVIRNVTINSHSPTIQSGGHNSTRVLVKVNNYFKMSVWRQNLYLISLLLALSLISGHQLHNHHPLATTDQKPLIHHQSKTLFTWPLLTKKNVFISRGWGASGMPLSTEDSSSPVEQPGQAGGGGRNIIDRLWTNNNNNNKPKTTLRQQQNQHRAGQRDYSIPQLFVSYGWGPMG